MELQDFLRSLDVAFRQSGDLMKRRAYDDLIDLWSPAAASPLFDPMHGEWKDKPYYRCQIGSGICQLFIAHANSMDDKDVYGWLTRVLGYLSKMIELEPLDPQTPGYFYGNTEATAAQNYNLALMLGAAEKWLRGWSPDIISAISDMPEAAARDLVTAARQRVRDLAAYLA